MNCLHQYITWNSLCQEKIPGQKPRYTIQSINNYQQFNFNNNYYFNKNNSNEININFVSQDQTINTMISCLDNEIYTTEYVPIPKAIQSCLRLVRLDANAFRSA